MGLPLDESGHVVIKHGLAHFPGTMADVSRKAFEGILRLASKVVNTISSTAHRSTDCNCHADSWTNVHEEVDLWVNALPPSFQPDTLLHDCNASPVADLSLSNIWFANDTCALAVLYYHMAKILLLLHKPTAAVETPLDWLRSYRALQPKLVRHSKELLTIALGTSDDVVRMHLVQPIYVASRCLDLEDDQRTSIKMLESLETDLGIATGYRIQALIREWDNPSLRHTSELDFELSDLSSAED
jgi:hypothetical protein